jgi:hypothetical protein
MGEQGGAAAVSAARIADPTAGGVDPWQFNVAESSGAAAAANPKAEQDPWQYNLGTDSSPAAANPRAGMDPWQYNVTSESGSSAVSASGDSSVLGDVAPIVGAAGVGAVLLIAGAAFVTSSRRRVPAT